MKALLITSICWISLSFWAQPMAAATAVGLLNRSLHPNDAENFLAQQVEENESEEVSGPTPKLQSYDLGSHHTLSRVILMIRENYVEPERIKPYEMFMAALDFIQKTIPEIMVDEMAAPEKITLSVGSHSQVFELGSIHQLWEVTMSLRDIFRFLQLHVTDPEKKREIEYAAINGMLSTLDPHSVLLRPESSDEVKLSTKGEFGGLGIVISIRDGALTVISPIEGTPASKAGIKAKDQIVKIGEESTVNMGLDEAVQRLRGRIGSKVTIWIQRKSYTEPKKFILERANIKIESVSSQLLKDGIGYLKIKSFQNNTYSDLENHLEKLRQKNQGPLQGLILDLRNNPGGLLDQAIMVSDRFIEKGPLVITVGRGNKDREVKNARYTGNENQFPMAVLLNGGSASASEIVSGALKNHNRAFIIGQQSFGKGSVQVLYDSFQDRSALKLTIAQYLTPGDISIQSLGITPDIAIVPALIDANSIHLFVDDESPREKDLNKHLIVPSKETDAEKASNMSSLDDLSSLRDANFLMKLTVPRWKIMHLMPNEEKVHDANHPEEPQPESFEYDFEIELAHDMLLQANQLLSRQGILDATTGLLQQKSASEQAVIAKRLGELKVDWSTGASQPLKSQDVEVTLHASPTGILKAGQELHLTGHVKNISSKPLFQLYAVTTSDQPLFKNLEFVFGQLQPGESRQWQVSVKLPQDLSTRTDRITLQMGDATGLSPNTQGFVIVSTEELAKPHLSCAYHIDDRSKGNGDGLLSVGEHVLLNVLVKNTGAASAEDVIVTLKNQSGKSIFLEQGRFKIGKLQPGEEKPASLSFAIKRNDANVLFKIAIWDVATGTLLTESINLPVVSPAAAIASKGFWHSATGNDVALFTGASKEMPLYGFVSAQSVFKSDLAFNDWLRVYLNEHDYAFVPMDAVKKSLSGKKRVAEKVQVRLDAALSPPLIHLQIPTKPVTQANFLLEGLITDERRLKDIFLFVNDKKVYYKNLSMEAESGKLLHLPVQIPIPLQVGINIIALVIREDEDMMNRKIFAIYRSETPTKPTVEGNGKGKTQKIEDVVQPSLPKADPKPVDNKAMEKPSP